MQYNIICFYKLSHVLTMMMMMLMRDRKRKFSSFVIAKKMQSVIFSLENDKENDSRSATQGVIQRRRRPKRRSTGVVHVDMDVKKH